MAVCAVGGTRDALALIKTRYDHEAPMRIVEAVMAVNNQRKRAMARKVAAVLGGNLRGRTVAVLGLAFKPNTDDMREAPSIALITALQHVGAAVRAYDPPGMEQAKPLLPDIACAGSAYGAEGADALEWEQFRALDLARLRAIMAQPIVVDLRNVYRPFDLSPIARRIPADPGPWITWMPWLWAIRNLIDPVRDANRACTLFSVASPRSPSQAKSVAKLESPITERLRRASRMIATNAGSGFFLALTLIRGQR